MSGVGRGEPAVGIVVLDLDQRAQTERCLESLAAGDEQPSVVVLVENGDQSFEHLDAGLSSRFRFVRLSPSHNLGCAGGRNHGLDHLAATSAAGVFVVLDNDTVVPRDFVAYLRANPPAGVLAPLIRRYDDPSAVWSCGGGVSADGTLYPLEPGPPSASMAVDWAPGACLAFGRQVWARVGPFHPAMGFFFNDVDWCARAREQGFPVVVDTRLEIQHEANSSLGGEWSTARTRRWACDGTVFQATSPAVADRHLSQWVGGQLRHCVRDVRRREARRAVARASGLAQGLAAVATGRVRRAVTSR